MEFTFLVLNTAWGKGLFTFLQAYQPHQFRSQLQTGSHIPSVTISKCFEASLYHLIQLSRQRIWQWQRVGGLRIKSKGPAQLGKNHVFLIGKIFTNSEMCKLDKIHLQQLKYEVIQHWDRIWPGKLDINGWIFVTVSPGRL